METKSEINVANSKENIEQLAQQISVYEVHHLPLVRGYMQKLDLVETMNRLIKNEMEVKPGILISGLLIDTLSGRSPLYRISDFFRGKDTEILIGHKVDADAFNDDNVGRLLDHIYETGTQKLFSAISTKAIKEFGIDTSVGHMDTTSRNVWGEYRGSVSEETNSKEEKNQEKSDSDHKKKKPIVITHGYSKDHRADLKQFITSLLCVEKNIPILHTIEDGNKQDKTINNKLLSSISSTLATYKIKDDAFIYIGDSAVVTEDNLKELDGRLFITRLPASYKECLRVIEEAIVADKWEEVGTIAETPGSKNRPPASYKVHETRLTLYETEYRAIVVHSSSHDSRMDKRITKEIKEDLDLYTKTLGSFTNTFACRKDAENSLQKMEKVRSDYHSATIEIKESPIYARGPAPKNGPRKTVGCRYLIEFSIQEDEDKINKARSNQGCFVLIAPLNSTQNYSPEKILRSYKEQHGVERNFSFLKDPLIVNSLFLKSPSRIEALGFILVLALLVWNLMERNMRQYASNNPDTLDGWDKKKTNRPTSFMMTTKFQSILIMYVSGVRILARPLNERQKSYIEALGLKADIFTNPNST